MRSSNGTWVLLLLYAAVMAVGSVDAFRVVKSEMSSSTSEARDVASAAAAAETAEFDAEVAEVAAAKAEAAAFEAAEAAAEAVSSQSAESEHASSTSQGRRPKLTKRIVVGDLDAMKENLISRGYLRPGASDEDLARLIRQLIDIYSRRRVGRRK